MIRRLWQNLTAPWRYSPFMATCSLLLGLLGALELTIQASRLAVWR